MKENVVNLMNPGTFVLYQISQKHIIDADCWTHTAV